VVKKSILITGGLGYLGGQLSRYFLGEGFNVIIGTSRKNAELPQCLRGCDLALIDLTDIDSLKSCCSEIEFVIHLAALNASSSKKNPKLAVEINGIGTLNLIEACIAAKVRYFLYFSTAHIYGTLTGVIEEKNLPKPSHPYSITHRLAEDFLLSSIESKKIKGSIIRLSNAIGAPVTKEADCWTLYSNEVSKQAVINRQIIIKSNPDTQRDFISISAICEVVDTILNKQPNAEFPVYNLGSGSSISLLDFAEIIVTQCKELFNFSPKLIYSTDEEKNTAPLIYKIDKLVNEIGYKPANNLVSSVNEILEFCDSEFN